MRPNCPLWNLQIERLFLALPSLTWLSATPLKLKWSATELTHPWVWCDRGITCMAFVFLALLQLTRYFLLNRERLFATSVWTTSVIRRSTGPVEAVALAIRLVASRTTWLLWTTIPLFVGMAHLSVTVPAPLQQKWFPSLTLFPTWCIRWRRAKLYRTAPPLWSVRVSCLWNELGSRFRVASVDSSVKGTSREVTPTAP